jgi:hypothetical protein
VSLLQAGGPLQGTMPQVCCPIRASTGYGRIRAKLPNEKVYVYDLLEDSVDSDVCANCLSADCDWNTCIPPVDNFLFQESSKSFVEDGMWDMVSEAKSRNPPLSKELLLQTHDTEEDYWGKDGGEHHEDSDGGEEEDSN